MEELQPEELEDLVQELQAESDEEEALSPDVEELLRDLQSGSAALDRMDAAEQLGEVGTSNPQIVRALIAAYESDSYSMVSRAAAKALRAPVHQEYLQQHPGMMERTKAAPDPSDEAAQHLERAFALEDEDKYEGALEECDAAIRLGPDLADAHNLRGVILEELGREREAVLAYREALRLDPGFDAARENLQAVETELQAGGAKTQAVVERWVEEQVAFEAEDGTSYYTWQLARVELEPAEGTLTVHGLPEGRPTITIPVRDIVNYEMVEREDLRRDLYRMAAGGGVGGGDWGDAVLPAILEIIDRAIARSTKVLVPKLTQSASDASSQGWVIHLRSNHKGDRGQIATFEMAQRIGAFLCLTGYGGVIPKELNLPKAPEALVKVVQARQEQLASAGSPACATIGRFVVWSSLAGLVAGLVIGMINAKNHWYLPVESLDLVPGTLLALAVGGTVGAALGAALRWREHPRRIVGMIAGAIVAAIAASLSHFIAFFVWIGY